MIFNFRSWNLCVRELRNNSVVDGYTLSRDKPTLIVSYSTRNAWTRVSSGVTLDWSYKTFLLETSTETNTRCSAVLYCRCYFELISVAKCYFLKLMIYGGDCASWNHRSFFITIWLIKKYTTPIGNELKKMIFIAIIELQKTCAR